MARGTFWRPEKGALLRARSYRLVVGAPAHIHERPWLYCRDQVRRHEIKRGGAEAEAAAPGDASQALDRRFGRFTKEQLNAIYEGELRG